MELPTSLPIFRKNNFYNSLFLLLSLVVFLITYSSYILPSSPSVTSLANLIWPNPKPSKKNKEKLPFAIGETKEGCNVFNGKWIWDEKRPLYEEYECPYIQPQLTCQEHGRPDKDYQHWRWQPHDCSLPRKSLFRYRRYICEFVKLEEVADSERIIPKSLNFGPRTLIIEVQILDPPLYSLELWSVLTRSFNATLMLETLRGKKMLFVGDSLNRGQYVSMVCLVHRIILEDSKSMTTVGSFDVFTIKDYNATIEFYWAPFLLESNSDNPGKHRIEERVVRKDSIDTHGKYWKGADIIVFNTYLWWRSGFHFNILQGSFDDEVKHIVEVFTEEAYRMAMKSLVTWIKKNMDSKKTRVFFTSMSPSHERSIEWGGESNKTCYNETKMIEDPNYWGSDSRKSIMQVIKEEFSKSKVPITFLNITQLSSYRKDAHTTIYKKQWNKLTQEQLANPFSYADCFHWCLPGLQDTWNELLFTKLFYP